jgi:hypothetical protein
MLDKSKFMLRSLLTVYPALSASYFTVMHCHALSCSILHCLASSYLSQQSDRVPSVLHCPAPSYTACTALHCSALFCIFLQCLICLASCTALHGLALSCTVLQRPALSCTVQHCPTLSCTALHCLRCFALCCTYIHHLMHCVLFSLYMVLSCTFALSCFLTSKLSKPPFSLDRTFNFQKFD